MPMLSRPPARRCGTASLELAVTLAFILLPLLLGVWEVGRLVEATAILDGAAREAGREVSTGQYTTTDAKSAVNSYLQRAGFDSTGSDVVVTNLTSSARSDPSKASQLDQFQVRVTLPFDNVRWVLLDKITNISTLTAQSNWYSMKDVPVTVSTQVPVE